MRTLSNLNRDIFPTWKRILHLRVSLWEALKREQLNKYERAYEQFANSWVEAREKVTILEKLINPKDKDAERKFAITMGAGYLKQLQIHEVRLTRTMSDIGATLRDKRAEADYKRTLFISIMAIIVAVGSVLYSVFY
jgi:hypothetical protein